MRLFHKGVLLIAIPIIGQFIFVLVLLAANRSSEELAWQDQHYRSETQNLMSMTVALYKAISLLSAYGFANQEQFLTSFDRAYEQLLRKNELLVLMNYGQDTELKTKVNDSMKKTLGSLLQIRRLLALKNRGMSMNNPDQLVAEVSSDMTETLSILEQLIDTRAQAGLSDTNNIERSRTIFLVSILGGFAFNMILAAALLFAYARDFAGRFNIVLDNTSRVPKGLPLNPRIGGNDEIARLDSVLHDMNAALKEAEARKEQFMSMVSHDMRTPLASVQMATELMCNEVYGPLPKNMNEKLDACNRLLKRLSRLVNDILDFDKIKAGKLELTRESLSIDEQISQCLVELQTMAQSAGLELKSERSGLCALADKERVPQILINLISNAIKFGPRGSSIELRSFSDAGKVKITVRDYGPGIPEEHRETIFQPFEQVPDADRPKVGSSGIGLTICKMLVEMQGGEIGVSPPLEGDGSVFWFTLPLAVDREVASS